MTSTTTTRRTRAAVLLASTALALAGGSVLITTGSADAATCLPVPGACLPGTITATTPVGIAPDPAPHVDHAITATPPVWDDANAATTYQWQRDGGPISGATAQAYTVTVDDVGTMLTVVATATDGLAAGTSTSGPVTGAIGVAPAPAGAIAVDGVPRVGSAITAAPGAWSFSPAFSYQWYRGAAGAQKGGLIEGATGSTYTVTSGDVGRQLAAVVSATKPGHADGTAVSEVVRVPRTASHTKLAIAKAHVHRGERGRARIVLTTADHSAATGQVVLRDGSATIARHALTVGDDGLLLLTLPRLKPGVHHLRASYAGDATRTSSTSATVTFTVLATSAT